MPSLFSFIGVAALAFAPLLARAEGKTYYIDKSCTDRDSWDDAWKLAMDNAKSVKKRLDSSSDTDFENVVKQIFKIDRGDSKWDQIKAPFDDILSWTEVEKKDSAYETLKQADVRIFCDNDALVDGPGDNVHGPGRWRPRTAAGKEGQFTDIKNFMIMYGTPPCRRNLQIFGYTDSNQYKAITDPSHIYFGQKERRVVVTICDFRFAQLTWQTGGKRIHKLEQIDFENNAPDDREIMLYESLISHTILHELIHAAKPNYRDPTTGEGTGIGDYPNLQEAYNWKHIQKHDFNTAIRNADSYAELGLFAMFADRGYALFRVIEDMTRNEYHRARKLKFDQQSADQGYIKKYSDVTKRALRMIGRFFRY